MVIDFNTTVGPGISSFFSPEDLIQEMDENHVDMAVIAPPDRCLGMYNQEGNEYIAKTVQKYPKRFIGFGCVSPWLKDKEKEVDRIKDMGLAGIKMDPFIQGFMLSDRILDPIFQTCEKNHLPVLVNTGTPISSMPFQLREIALRFPKVVFVMGHMGFSDFWYDVTFAAEGLENIYLEFSYQMPSVILDAIEKCGSDRVLFGSDWPFSREKIEIEKAKLADGTTEQKLILGGNAARLLGITEVDL